MLRWNWKQAASVKYGSCKPREKLSQKHRGVRKPLPNNWEVLFFLWTQHGCFGNCGTFSKVDLFGRRNSEWKFLIINVEIMKSTFSKLQIWESWDIWIPFLILPHIFHRVVIIYGQLLFISVIWEYYLFRWFWDSWVVTVQVFRSVVEELQVIQHYFKVTHPAREGVHILMPLCPTLNLDMLLKKCCQWLYSRLSFQLPSASVPFAVI